MTEPFLLRALIASLGVAVVAAPLGCFVVWRRMAYFGDSLAHTALLGVALGLLLGIDPTLGILAAALALAILLVLLQRQQTLATDTVLGLLAHSGLALGVVALSFLPGVRVDLMSYLFGDILAVSWTDLIGILAGGAVALAGLAAIWRGLLSLTVHEELARAEGVPAFRLRLIFVLLLAVVVALGMKVVGVLLITSMLIIPAATVRRFSRTPERMAVLAALAAATASVLGLAASLFWDTPAGPSIVVAEIALFAAGLILGGAGRLLVRPA